MIGLKNDATREKWIATQLLSLKANSSILDVGAGQLRYKKYCSHLKYTAQDFAQYDGKGNAKGLQTGIWDQSKIDIVSDICSIPVADESYNSILCAEVFEHISDPISAIKELYRILKKDGTLILTAPFASLTHFAPYHFYSGFNKYFYDKWLIDVGFSNILIESNGNYFEYMAQELRRIESIAMQYAEHKINEINKNSINNILSCLQIASDKDKGSNDLLCFGYHIVAIK